VIKKSTRMLDVVSRYGGEEFAVILPETDAASARVVAERILHAVHDAYFSVSEDHPPVHITVSIGVATCPQDAESTNDLIELADKALYYSKETGKNKISVWSEVPVNALVDNG